MPDVSQVTLSAEVLALACMTEPLTAEQRRYYDDLIRPNYLPEMRAPVPMSHMSRLKTLPKAPAVSRVWGKAIGGHVAGGGAVS